MIRQHRWTLLAGALLLAAGLLVAGVLVWRITSTATFCPGALCGVKADQHSQIYPHRAEALWALSGILAVISLAVVIAPRIVGNRPPASPAVSDRR
ncbi:MAG: hypothetical protein QOF08_2897 [Gaiellales bacterium]|jgi:hypothetical protein|nr:hypothetical protein [Gaiellales bacterium]